MAEEFHTGVCSGSWWNAMRGGFEGPPMSAAAAVSCSAAASDAGSLGWGSETMESKTRSGEESAGVSASGGSTLTLHGAPGVHASDPMPGAAGFLIEQTVPMADSGEAFPSMDWNQADLRSNRRIEGGFQAMLQDHLSSSRSYLFQETSMDSDQTHKGTDNQWNRFKDFNQALMTHDHQAHLNSGGSSGDGADAGFQGSVPFACSPTLLHDLLDQDMKPRTSTFDTCSANLLSPASYRSSSGEPPRFPNFLKSSPLRHQRQLSSDHDLQFSSDQDPSFWSASTQTQFYTEQAFEGKPSHNRTITRKPNSEGARDSSSTTAKKSAGNEPVFKKSRIETPSSLPTFKVRKEKLGDRITALQQLVSPFGKTDTASVLHEAIEYIKFLHDQVGVLSAPYLKNGPAMQHNQIQKPDKSKDGADRRKQDLRSRGLCLVPVSATFPVVSEPTTADFWTPTFGGTYR